MAGRIIGAAQPVSEHSRLPWDEFLKLRPAIPTCDSAAVETWQTVSSLGLLIQTHPYQQDEAMPDIENRSPLRDQVIANTLETLSENADFDCDLLKRLEDMARKGDLANYQKVIAALRKGGEV